MKPKDGVTGEKKKRIIAFRKTVTAGNSVDLHIFGDCLSCGPTTPLELAERNSFITYNLSVLISYVGKTNRATSASFVQANEKKKKCNVLKFGTSGNSIITLTCGTDRSKHL